MHDVVPAEKSFTEVTSPLGSRAAIRVGSSPFRRTRAGVTFVSYTKVTPALFSLQRTDRVSNAVSEQA